MSTMKICSRCNVEKSESFFHKKRNGLQPYCKDCNSAIFREWKQKNNARHLESVSKRKQEIRAENAKYISNVKDVPCADCKQRFPSVCMDFDHIKGVKSDNVSYIANMSRLKTVKEEIEKCEVVCANCHRVRTYNRRISGLKPQQTGN